MKRMPRKNCVCSIADCSRPVNSRGFCCAHYRRYRLYGNPTFGRSLQVTPGEVKAFFDTKVVPFAGDECLLWPYSTDIHGYGKIRFEGQLQTVSRLACEIVYGRPPSEDHEAAHSCGKGHLGCVNPRHLRWATHLDNMQDRLAHGTLRMGETHPTAKLTEAEVREIKEKLKIGVFQRKIATEYGVSQQLISRIHQGSLWASLE